MDAFEQNLKNRNKREKKKRKRAEKERSECAKKTTDDDSSRDEKKKRKESSKKEISPEVELIARMAKFEQRWVNVTKEGYGMSVGSGYHKMKSLIIPEYEEIGCEDGEWSELLKPAVGRIIELDLTPLLQRYPEDSWILSPASNPGCDIQHTVYPGEGFTTPFSVPLGSIREGLVVINGGEKKKHIIPVKVPPLKVYNMVDDDDTCPLCLERLVITDEEFRASYTKEVTELYEKEKGKYDDTSSLMYKLFGKKVEQEWQEFQNRDKHLDDIDVMFCGHAFHHTCIDKYCTADIAAHKNQLQDFTCPICKDVTHFGL